MKKVMILAVAGLITAPLTILAAGQTESSSQLNVTLQDIEPFSYVCLPRKGSLAGIQDAVSEIWRTMQEQNIFPTGPMIGVYHTNPVKAQPENLIWEVGFPVMEQAFVQAPLEKKQWIFKTVAVAQHVGPYDKTEETISKMAEWLEANGYVPNGPILEKYLDMDPLQVKPENLKTEIWIPCKKG